MHKHLNAEQEMIRAQLTLRAIVWDIEKMEAPIWKRLEQEAELYRIHMIRIQELAGETDRTKKYNRIMEYLKKSGIAESQALLVTEDDQLPDAVCSCKTEPGMGVVYYEKAGSRQDVAADMIVLGFEETGPQFFDRILKRRNHLPWNILYTERTCVREITMEDLDELYELYEGDGITDYTEPLFERQEEEAYTKSYIEYMYYYYGYGMWIVRDRKNGALIGRAGIEHREGEAEVFTELGYVIGRNYQNKGYATEVCQAILDYAKEEAGMDQIHCFIHPGNQVSLHLAKKLGFEIVEDTQKIQTDLIHFRKRF